MEKPILNTISFKMKSDFIDPRWMRDLQSYDNKIYILENRRIELDSEVLITDCDIPDFSKILLRVSSSKFEGYLLEEWENYQRYLKEKEAQETIDHKKRLNMIRDQAIEFNSSFEFPFKWGVGKKAVLSGLTKNSWGDGRKSNTVIHILLLEDFKESQFERRNGNFLCTSKSGSDGKRWTSPFETSIDGDGETYQPKITCKQCLKIAEKWKKHGFI